MTSVDKEAVRAASRLEDVIPALTGGELTPRGRELVACCPFHDDRHPSMRVSVEKQQWFCDVCVIGGDVFAFVERFRHEPFAEALVWLAHRAGLSNGNSHDASVPTRYPRAPEREHIYVDERGEPVRKVVIAGRRPDGTKIVWQEKPDGCGNWVKGTVGQRRVIYRLPDLLGKPAVVVAEGEKDVDRLWAIGIPATCNLGGAGNWTGSDSQQLKDAGVQRVCAIGDNDEAGRRHNQVVAQSCRAHGLDMRVVLLPGVPDKGDVSDYLDAHSKDDLHALVSAAPLFQPDTAAPPPTGEPAPTFHQTDSGNAEFFAAHAGRDVRYDHARARFLLWRAQRWQPDADAEIRQLAKLAMRQRAIDAARLDDTADARLKATKWAIASESRARLDALLYLAQAEWPIADKGDAWDADPTLLGTPNGVIDLRTGVLRPARREDRMTLSTAVAYDPQARSDRWEAALAAILPDATVRDFFHIAIGYSVTGDNRCDCWFLPNGSGRNGKGTVLQPIRHALGDYALELPGSIFDFRSERSPYELASLPGRRFVTSSESGDTLRLHHDRIKQLTGGDSMNASNKYEKAFEFDPVCKLWLACNKKPRTTDDTVAFWARVVLIPFTQSFVGKEDRDLRPALVQDPMHQAAVLAWIVRGAVRYYAEGLPTPPDAVTAATADYREASDPLGAFLADACDTGPDARTAEVGAADLYDHYIRWADRERLVGPERLSATMFGKRVSEQFERVNRAYGRAYLGLARRP